MIVARADPLDDPDAFVAGDERRRRLDRPVAMRYLTESEIRTTSRLTTKSRGDRR
jgi:hypothetical protein